MKIRHILRRDLSAGGAVLAAAFYRDPVMTYLYPDDATREADLASMFEVTLTAGLHRGTTYLIEAPGPVGAAEWSPPDVEAATQEETASIGPKVWERYGDEGIARLRGLGEIMAGYHPEETHYYLWIAGVVPSQQGLGLGAALLAPVLAQCDNDGVPGYLESSNPRNVPFYQRLGFVVRSEFGPDGGPVLTGMWRDPR